MELEPREYFLPRLTREFYQGAAVVHWTLTVFDQKTGWLNDSFHQIASGSKLGIDATKKIVGEGFKRECR